jgi:pimeloyl-ACP methyl ester carboxylesterase
VGGGAGITPGERLDVGGGRLFHEERGTGQPVVLVHGEILGRRVWDPLLAPLSRRYRVIRFDQRGYGESDRPKGTYSYWEDLKKLSDARGLSDAVYVGVGQGAAAIVDFALAFPEKVKAAVLISPFLHGYDYSPVFRSNLVRLADAYLAQGGTAVADALMRDAHYPPDNSRIEERRRLRELILENAHVLGFNWMHLRPLEPLAATRLGEFVPPSLILCGDRDNVDNLSAADRLRYELPGTQYQLIAGAGHVLPVDAPAPVTEAIVSFLSSL